MPSSSRSTVTLKTIALNLSIRPAGQDVGRLSSPFEPSPEEIGPGIPENGRARGQGQMPSGLLVGKEADDVAAFVAAVAGH